MARRAGFAAAAVAAAGEVAGEDTCRAWLADGCGEAMPYLHRNVSKRFHPAELVPGARSVLCLAVGYAPAGDGPAAAGVEGGTAGRQAVCGARSAPRGAITIGCSRSAACASWTSFAACTRPSRRAGVRRLGAAGRTQPRGGGGPGLDRAKRLPHRPRLGQLRAAVRDCEQLAPAPGSPLAGGCGECDACIGACPSGACRGDGLIDARHA